MFSSQLEKIIDLAKRTGDKVIVMPEFGEPFAMVPLEQYEEMTESKIDYAGMTEEEILNRVNREISLWKQAQREIGLSSDVDFFSPRDLGEDLMPRLSFERGFDNDYDLVNERRGERTFDPLAGEEEEEEKWDSSRWPEDLVAETKSKEKEEKEEKEEDWKINEEGLDEDWLNEEMVGDVNYETEKPAEANKDLPTIEADAENVENEVEKKDIDEFLVEPIE
jgi:hypothetical protein